MGMAASQVRFLSLQNRKNTIGLNLSTLSNRKLALSRDMNRVAAEYNNAMNEKTLKWSNNSGVTYNDLTYDTLMKPNELNSILPYILTDSQGRVVVDDQNIVVDGIKSNYSYRDLAELISTYSGTSAITNTPEYDNINNIIGGVGNAIAGNPSMPNCEYTNVSSVDQYDIKQNALRYDLLSKLGVITEDDYNAFLSAAAGVAGNEIGEKFQDWDSVLLKYINDGGLSNTSNPVSVTLPNPDNNGVSSVPSNVYFGKWDATKSEFVGGCAKGNLALAKYELEEYKNWCGKLHQAQLSATTTHTFTGLSGIQLTQETQPMLSYFDNAQIGNEAASTQKNIVDLGINTYGNFDSWSKIFTEKSSIGVTGLEGNDAVGVLLSIGNTLLETISSASNSGTTNDVDGWSITNNIEGDEVNFIDNDGNIERKDLADAANEFALRETINFYATTWTNVKHVGSCYGSGQEGYAADRDQDYNGVVKAKRKWKWWEHLLNGIVTVINIASFGGLDRVMGLFGADTASGDFLSLNNMWNTDMVFAKNSGYSFDVSNFMKTYFTYYEMYIQSEGKMEQTTKEVEVEDYTLADNLEIQLGEEDSLQKSNELSYASYYDSTTGKTYNRYYTLDSAGNKIWGQERKDDADGVTRIYVDPNGNQYTTTLKQNLDDEGNPSTGFTPAKEIYIDGCGNTVIKEVLSDGAVKFSYSNASGLKIFNENVGAPELYKDASGKSYKNVVVTYTSDGSVSYSYDGGVPPTKTEEVTTWVPSPDSGYSGNLNVANTGSVFTDSISVYLTATQNNLTILQNRINKANENLQHADTIVEGVFSEKEKRLMAYFDAIFLQISKNGWVYDESVNSDDTTASKNYLNAKLQNNMYFITEVDTLDGTDFNYATKIATNVSKVFQVYDTDAQNAAIAKYEAESAEISSKEKQVDLRMNKLEAEQDAISTELDSIKKIIEDNVSSTFKIFT